MAVEELAAVPGMTRQAAENVYYFFRLGTDEKRKVVENKADLQNV